jgi:cytochrome c biogenesis protein CcdA
MIASLSALKDEQGRAWAVTGVVAVVALAVAVASAMAVGSGGGIDPINLFVEGKLSGNSQEFLGGLIGGTALFALAAGMASAVNPCGFAMLPAYLGLYLGSNLAEEERPGPVAAVLRGLVVGGAVSAGFILLFGVVGGAVGLSASFISDFLPWLGLIIGAALVGTGAWMVAGGRLYMGIAARAANRLGNPNTVSIKSFFTFGISYGTASLSCALPIFIAVVGIGSATSSLLQVIGNFFLYAFGMGLVIMAMTLGMAIFKEAMARMMRRALPYIQPVASAFMVIAGAYIVFYWLTVGRDNLL